MALSPAHISLSFKTRAFAIPVFEASIESWALSVSSFEDPEDAAQWIISALFDPETRPQIEEALLPELLKLAHEQNLPFSSSLIVDIPPTDWVQETYQAFPPFEVGRFYIHGGHVQPRPSDSAKIPLQIEAATAFGSGEHATTKGCLLLLESLCDQERLSTGNLSLMDLGTGTGILAFAMAHLFKCPVLATDNDPEAVRVTQENARLNNLETLTIPALSEGCEGDLIKGRAPYDLITANILAGPLLALAQDFGRLTRQGSFLILSGLLQTQVPEILKVYEKIQFHLVDHKCEGDWAALLLRKE
jgi:ribosomal protein L11 methyltransferase